MFIVITYKPVTLYGKPLDTMHEPGNYFTTESWNKAMEYLDAFGVSWKCELWFFDTKYRAWYRIRFQFNDRDTREFIQ